eukprot:TRINITY_DN3167_c1_g1_i1.p2 TRINITY_DN3167_c1_g1~~TRINITY_DN3167_c1_g1_i1.p2  ORF type:complete len:672 (+),score=255.20 TRINITY_DN3167_c1_g1_i1:67-2082(+)
MKGQAAVLLSAAVALSHAETANPVGKVLQMIGDLQAKIIAEGEEGQKSYDEYAEWCEETSKNLNFEIKTGKQNVDELKATINDMASKIESLTARVEELASATASAEKDLKAATDVRNQEAAAFADEEKELEDVLNTLGRAISILERELAKGGASMLQGSDDVVKALGTLVQASLLSTADGSKLTALLQSAQTSDDSEDDAGAPAGAVYESKSGSIVDVLGDMQSKAEAQLEESRKKESQALHNFKMVKQSLDDEIKFATKDSDAAKKEMAASSEKKAVAQGDLDITTKDLIADKKGLGDTHRSCMNKAEEFETATRSRTEELKALATAKKIIAEATGGAVSQTYSFVQISAEEQSKFEAARIVKDLARTHKSAALAQLASRMNNVMRVSSEEGSDPFAKIKGMISDMLDKLQKESEADATENAFCEKEMSESNAKKQELETDVQKLSTKIDQDSARRTKLKGEVAVLSKELKDLAKSVASWTKFRQEEKAMFNKDSAELEQGLNGIKTALKVLRDYYAANEGSGGDGSAGGIVSLLEVCESDFSKGLAEMKATEEAAVNEYETEMKDAEIEKAAKDKDVEYKTKESIALDKAVTEGSSDRQGLQKELDAVNEYLTQLEGRCVGKAESYEERVKAREEELAGLRNALDTLSDSGASLIQQSRRVLRGARRHA